MVEKLSLILKKGNSPAPTNNAIETNFGLGSGTIILNGDTSVNCSSKDVGTTNRSKYLTIDLAKVELSKILKKDRVFRHQQEL